MLAAITNFFLNLVATLIQVILLPINTIIANALPDLTAQINQVTNGIAELLSLVLSILEYISTLSIVIF